MHWHFQDQNIMFLEVLLSYHLQCSPSIFKLMSLGPMFLRRHHVQALKTFGHPRHLALPGNQKR
jgi:hypothetical protein